jgi:hypothetical protein
MGAREAEYVIAVILTGLQLIFLGVIYLATVDRLNWFPIRFKVRRTNPVFRVQVFQIIASTVLTSLGIYLGLFSSNQENAEFRCEMTIVSFGMIFGSNIFAGYLFSLIKGLTVDASWHKSKLKEFMRVITSFLLLLPFVIAYHLDYEYDEVNGCSFKGDQTWFLTLMIIGIVLDLFLNMGYSYLFIRPLKETMEIQKQSSREGVKRSEKIQKLIYTNAVLYMVCSVCVILSIVLLSVSMISKFESDMRHLALLAAYITPVCFQVCGVISTKNAWEWKKKLKAPPSIDSPSDPNRSRNTKSNNSRNSQKPLELSAMSAEAQREEEKKEEVIVAVKEEKQKSPDLVLPNAVGRGGYNGAAGVGKYDIKVDLQFKINETEILLDKASLAAIAENQAEQEGIAQVAAQVARGGGAFNLQGFDDYLEPAMNLPNAIGRGGGQAKKKPVFEYSVQSSVQTSAHAAQVSNHTESSSTKQKTQAQASPV